MKYAMLPVLVLLAACNRDTVGPATPDASTAAASAPAASAPASAAVPAGPIIAPTAFAEPGDARRNEGATLASQGGGPVVACASCHGQQGEGNAASAFPRIAGQSYNYLLHELQSYAQGTRKHPVMQPIAQAMNDAQREAAAAYYASLAPSANAASSGASSASSALSASSASNAATAKASSRVAQGGRGRQLAEVGDESKGVQSCANCHGPGGIGSGELYPWLAGQRASYLSAALGAWRDGSRNNDPSGQMPVIAKSLTPEDVQAIASYYAAQPPRRAAVDQDAMATTPSTSPAVTSGPNTATVATQSPAAGGTEQGAALSGGAQGPGGGGGTGAASTRAAAGAAGAAGGASTAR